MDWAGKKWIEGRNKEINPRKEYEGVRATVAADAAQMAAGELFIMLASFGLDVEFHFGMVRLLNCDLFCFVALLNCDEFVLYDPYVWIALRV